MFNNYTSGKYSHGKHAISVITSLGIHNPFEGRGYPTISSSSSPLPYLPLHSFPFQSSPLPPHLLVLISSIDLQEGNAHSQRLQNLRAVVLPIDPWRLQVALDVDSHHSDHRLAGAAPVTRHHTDLRGTI